MTILAPIVRRTALSVAVATGLLASPLSHAAGSPADVQNAWNAISATLATVVSSDTANKLRTAHDKLKDYQFRTVYEFTQVSKDPLPGTRLGLQPLPTMSQLDAEGYLSSLPAFAQVGGIPALNCPVAKMGGAPGRTITFTVPGTSSAIPLSDAQIQAYMVKASPTQGEAAFQAYMALKTNTCAAIYNVAQLSFRTKKFQDMQPNWEECSKNGVQISSWKVGERFGFPGGIHRTVQAGGGMLFKCGAIYKGNADDALGYDSWFKFSDDQPVPMNLWQLLKDAGDSKGNCPRVCIPVVGGGSLSAGLCMGVDPGITAIGDTVPMRLGVNFRYRKRDKEFCTPVINVPAPFGVAQSLGEMAESGKQQLANELQNQLLGALPINSDTANKIKQLAAMLK